MLRKALAGIALVGGMWLYAALFLFPLRLPHLRRSRGALPAGGMGLQFSVISTEPHPDDRVGLGAAPFDPVATDYDRCVGPFAEPIFAAALDAMRPHLARSSRVLDVGCGPGASLRRVARLLPDGEVVGVDLSIEMLRLAHERSKKEGLGNVAFYQADAAELPSAFGASFDVAYSCLVHHHLERPLDAVRNITASLRPGGVYGAIDATGAVLTTLASPLARAVDPGWVGFMRRQPLLDLMRSAGLDDVHWIPLSPGVGMAIGTRA
jgi:ubiquinone/menaquinone biosynthesis C-methylase UbiE